MWSMAMFIFFSHLVRIHLFFLNAFLSFAPFYAMKFMCKAAVLILSIFLLLLLLFCLFCIINFTCVHNSHSQASIEVPLASEQIKKENIYSSGPFRHNSIFRRISADTLQSDTIEMVWIMESGGLLELKSSGWTRGILFQSPTNHFWKNR